MTSNKDVLEAIVGLDKTRCALASLNLTDLDDLENDVILYWQVSDRLHRKLSKRIWYAQSGKLPKDMRASKIKRAAEDYVERLKRSKPTPTQLEGILADAQAEVREKLAATQADVKP